MSVVLVVGFTMYMCGFKDFIVSALKVKPTVEVLRNKETARAMVAGLLLITAIGGGLFTGLGFLVGYLLRSSLFTWLMVGFGIFYTSFLYYLLVSHLTLTIQPQVRIDMKTREDLDKTIIIIDNEAWVGNEKCMNKTNPEETVKLIE
jgi:hypothetical protein